MPGVLSSGGAAIAMPCPSPDSSRPPANTRSGIWLWVVLALLLTLGFALDGTVLAAVKPLHHSPLADAVNDTIRLVGTGYVQLPVALLMILVGAFVSSRLRRAGGWTFLAFLLSGVAVNVLKVVVHRPRPWTTEPAPATWLGYLRHHNYQSFPSAETATTFAVVLTIATWYPALRLPLLVVAVLVGLARVFVGSHHPSDVVAGAMVGIAVWQALGRLARRRETESGGR